MHPGVIGRLWEIDNFQVVLLNDSMPTIDHLSALEILDSRGRPTIQAFLRLAGGQSIGASVPSGASTGRAEAWELRDGDPARYGGWGCRQAVEHVCGPIARRLIGQKFQSQKDLDGALLELDSTPSKKRLGANAILAVSLVFARAAAAQRGLPLYRYFAELAGYPALRLPQLTVNLFSGGKHAGAQTAIQDVLVVPRTESVARGLEQVYAVYQAAAALILAKYHMRALAADEGGLAPDFPSTAVMLQDAVESIRRAGQRPGETIALAVDVAASHFYAEGRYVIDGQRLDAPGMIEHVARWVQDFPIISLEDGLAEDDWSNWPQLRQRLARQAMVLGDDFLCTNPARIERAVATHAADALLLKVNQVGTLTEALQALRLARAAGWKVVISARSGETEDNWLADLAVGFGGDQIKIGSITRSERLAKYNRLLQIEAELRPSASGPEPEA